MMTVLVEYINHLLQFLIKQCINIAIYVFYILSVMLVLCLILSMTHYAGIIGGFLVTGLGLDIIKYDST